MGELLLGGWGGDTAQGTCPWLAANLANLGEGGGEAVYHSRLSWGWEAPMTSFSIVSLMGIFFFVTDW